MQSEKSRKFVDFVISGIHGENKAFRSKFAQADNSATEYRCWDILAKWVDLEKHRTRRAFAVVGASLARARPSVNGTLGLGTALYSILRDSTTNDSNEIVNSPRLRRVLACRDSQELISVLRATLKLIESKGLILDYARLLDEIVWFDAEQSRERTTARWAQEFYGRKEAQE